MARKLVAFGNVAVGPIAIGNVAIGYVAIGLSVAIGPVAIGINSLGFILALGLNAAGPFSFALVNGFGAASFTLVNAIGAFAWSLANHGAHPAIGAVIALAEGSAAYALRARDDERLDSINPALDEQSVRLECERADRHGLVLRDGSVVPWADDVFGHGLELPGRVRVRLRADVLPTSDEGYREGRVDRKLVVIDARDAPIARWWAPVFRRSLMVGAVLATAISLISALVR